MAAKKPTEFLYHKSGKEVNLPYTSYTLVLTVGILYNCKETSKQHEQPKHQSIQFLDYTIAHKKMWKEPNKHQHPNNHQPFHPSPTNKQKSCQIKIFHQLRGPIWWGVFGHEPLATLTRKNGIPIDPTTERQMMIGVYNHLIRKLVGGSTNPFDKNIRQFGSFPPFSGWT